MKAKNPGLRGDLSVPSVAVILVVVLIMPLMAGCAKRTPEQTVAGAIDAAMDGNVNRAKTFYTQRFLNENEGDENYSGDMTESFEMPEGSPSFEAENLESEIAGDTARVWHEDIEMIVFVLKQEGGQWKIDDVEVDFGSMLEGVDMSGFEMPEGMELPEGFEMPGS